MTFSSTDVGFTERISFILEKISHVKSYFYILHNTNSNSQILLFAFDIILLRLNILEHIFCKNDMKTRYILYIDSSIICKRVKVPCV